MLAWSQVLSLAIAAAGFAAALLPRDYYYRNSAGGGEPYGLSMGRRLARFPIFWIGLALLIYIALQAANPAWRYTQTATQWWLVRQRDIPWLPAGIAAPFARFNAWRQLMIYASAWLSVCSVWVGLTRRRSLRILMGVIVCNSLLLVGLLAIQRISEDHRMPWPLTTWTSNDLTASFVYENHAGAYLGLATFSAIALATWFLDYGRRSFAKSTPAGVFALGTLFLIGAVVFTLSRGALLALAMALGVLAGWVLLRRRMQPNIP